jgi:HEAT repeat protein
LAGKRKRPDLRSRYAKLSVQQLIARLRTGKSHHRMEAAMTLSVRKGCVPALLREFDRRRSTRIREDILYAISHSIDQRAWQTLLAVFSDGREPPAIRGQAAEGIAYLSFAANKHGRNYRHAVNMLTAALDDPSPVVRFWAIFALGSAGARSALPKLRALARSDRAYVEGWWRVKDEAADVVEALETGNWPDRERRPAK